jgi:hypothetical protein
MTKPIDLERVAATNPGVDVAKIKQADAYRETLARAGVLSKPTYQLTPALGPTGGKTHRTGSTIVRMSRNS